jgi:hypothetical protein
MTTATIYWVKNKPYTDKTTGQTKVYPEAIISLDDAKPPEGEMGIPFINVKLSPEIASRFTATEMRHNKHIRANVSLVPRQYNLAGKRITDLYLENFSPIAEQK